MRHSDQIIVTCDDCREARITLAHLESKDDIGERLREAGWHVMYRREEMPACPDGKWGGARVLITDKCPECCAKTKERRSENLG